MSREHLLHHVTAGWGFTSRLLLAWLGVIAGRRRGVAAARHRLLGPAVEVGLARGLVLGYGFYPSSNTPRPICGHRGTATSAGCESTTSTTTSGRPMANHG